MHSIPQSLPRPDTTLPSSPSSEIKMEQVGGRQNARDFPPSQSNARKGRLGGCGECGVFCHASGGSSSQMNVGFSLLV